MGNEDEELNVVAEKLRRRLIAFETVRRALRFYVGATCMAVMIYSGYGGWSAALAIGIVGLAYGHLSMVTTGHGPDI